jgi:hypothetical protein
MPGDIRPECLNAAVLALYISASRRLMKRTKRTTPARVTRTGAEANWNTKSLLRRAAALDNSAARGRA